MQTTKRRCAHAESLKVSYLWVLLLVKEARVTSSSWWTNESSYTNMIHVHTFSITFHVSYHVVHPRWMTIQSSAGGLWETVAPRSRFLWWFHTHDGSVFPTYWGKLPQAKWYLSCSPTERWLGWCTASKATTLVIITLRHGRSSGQQEWDCPRLRQNMRRLQQKRKHHDSSESCGNWIALSYCCYVDSDMVASGHRDAITSTCDHFWLSLVLLR